MAFSVQMPALGESVTEGTIGKWLKQPGEKVERYESIAEVISDKVNAEIPAPQEGVMGEHLVEEGAVVPVGQPICVIEEDAAGAFAARGAAQGAERGEHAGFAREPRSRSRTRVRDGVRVRRRFSERPCRN